MHSPCDDFDSHTDTHCLARFVDFIYIVAPISLVLLNPIAFGLMEYNVRRNVGSPCSIKVSVSDQGRARLVHGERLSTLCAGSVFDTVEGCEESGGFLHFFWHRGRWSRRVRSLNALTLGWIKVASKVESLVSLWFRIV